MWKMMGEDLFTIPLHIVSVFKTGCYSNLVLISPKHDLIGLTRKPSVAPL